MSGDATAASVLTREDVGPALLAQYRAPDGFAFVAEGEGLVTAGTAASALVGAGSAQGTRAAIAARVLLHGAGAAGVPELVVGALPFDGSVPALLTVPTTVIRPADVAGAAPWSGPTPPAGSSAAASPAARAVAAPEPAAYAAAVAEAVSRIRAGELDKVVLARSLVVASPSAAELAAILQRLHRRDPHARVYAAPIPGPDGTATWVVAGATPELLVRRTGLSIRSTPLAGTAPRHADDAADRDSAARLLLSVKDSAEHRFVVDAVADTLTPFCTTLSVEPAPVLERTAAVWHLATAIHGRLRSNNTSALDLVAALHPTPAVGGVPRDIAMRTIAELEPVPRGFFAGCVGWVDGAGDGEWYIALRCVETGPGDARLFAGAGIVAGSDPAEELAETEVKFSTLRDALSGGQ